MSSLGCAPNELAMLRGGALESLARRRLGGGVVVGQAHFGVFAK
jgi:hypothetical protein